MHPYLNDGLRYLLTHKSGPVEVVVANTENENYKGSDNPLHESTLCGRVLQLLTTFAPKLTCHKSSVAHSGIATFGNGHQMTPRYSFKEFIRTEMD